MDRSLAVLINSLGVGGAERQVSYLCPELVARGWRVRVHTLLPAATFAEPLRASGVEVEVAGPGRVGTARAIAHFGKTLRRERPTFLVSFLHHADIVARAFGKAAGVPVVLTSEWASGPRGAIRAGIRKATRWLDDGVVSNSRCSRDALLASGVARRGHAWTVWNAIDLSRFDVEVDRASVRASLGATPDTVLWLAVGNIYWAKNYPLMVSAFADMADSHPEAMLRIAGRQQEDVDALLSIRPDLWRAGRMAMLGPRSDVPELLAAADGVVMSSDQEGLPNALQEALAARRPVVATAVGGVVEIVPSEAGRLVPRRSKEALTAALADVSEMSREARTAMGEHGRAAVEARFSLQAIVDDWEALLAERYADWEARRARR